VKDSAVQPPPDFLRRKVAQVGPSLARVELLLDTHRITGVLDQTGAPRRLVDVLNSRDSPAAIVRDASVESLADPGQQPPRFDIAHVKKGMILLAIPIPNAAPSRDSLEAVKKRPTAATLILPGIEVTGDVHLPPGADPDTIRLLDSPDFLVVTDAEVAQSASGLSLTRRPLVVVNLGRVLLYAPAPR